MHHDWLDGQLGDVCRVRAVQFRPKDLGKITQLIPGFPRGWTISSSPPIPGMPDASGVLRNRIVLHRLVSARSALARAASLRITRAALLDGSTLRLLVFPVGPRPTTSSNCQGAQPKLVGSEVSA